MDHLKSDINFKANLTWNLIFKVSDIMSLC